MVNAPPVPPPVAPKKKRRSIVVRFLGFLFTAGVIAFLAASAAVGYVLWHISKDLPGYESLASYEPPVMTRIHAADGRLIAEYARERRIYVPINAIPKRAVIGAFLSAEDKNFYEHGGLDFQGIARAVFNHLVLKQRLTGASTITQQVAKNFLLTSERSFERKVKEAILAVRIERAYTKDQVLELYLNEIYLGLSSYGVAAAALNYYGKELEELTIADAAYLAALPKAPSNYHPFRKRKEAIARRNWVIEQMSRNGFITSKERDEAKATGLNVNPRPFGAHIFAGEFFAEEVRRTLLAMYGEDKLYGGGLSVRTTLRPDYQRMAKKALVDGLVRYDRRHGWRGSVGQVDLQGDWGVELAKIAVPSDINPWRLSVVLRSDKSRAVVGLRPRKGKDGKLEEAREQVELTLKSVKWAKPKKGKGVAGLLKPGDAVYVAPPDGEDGSWQLTQKPLVDGGIVVIDPHTGRVLALVGGFSFAESQFDRAVQARRQPGSAFKPFVYVTALDNGYTPSTVILDGPIAIDQGPGLEVWKPKNYGGKFAGPSTLRTGIERSRNLMTVRLARDVGMPLISEYARRFGIYDSLLPVLSMSLGAGETTLFKITAAYSMLANGGKKIEATLIDRIQDRYGQTVWSHDKRKCLDCASEEWFGQPEPELDEAREPIIDPHTAYQITSMLEGVVQRGTGTRVKKVGKPLAGKTGTTNDERDAWFVGFAPDLAVGVFVGYDSPKPMGKGETGGKVASPIFRDFMKMALADKPAVPFRIPPGIKLIRINRKTGLRAGGNDPKAILEAFKPRNSPGDNQSEYFGGTGSDEWFSPSINQGRGLY
ncbi:MAG: penicillin-binding protein 1A [Hyphomicrobiaceae bacterium]